MGEEPQTKILSHAVFPLFASIKESKDFRKHFLSQAAVWCRSGISSWWDKRIAFEDVFDSVDHIDSIFPNCWDIAPDAAECPGASLTSEGAWDFLLGLDHAEIHFREIVTEGHIEVIHERKGLRPVFVEMFEQISCFAFFLPSPFLSGGVFYRQRIFVVTFM